MASCDPLWSKTPHTRELTQFVVQMICQFSRFCDSLMHIICLRSLILSKNRSVVKVLFLSTDCNGVRCEFACPWDRCSNNVNSTSQSQCCLAPQSPSSAKYQIRSVKLNLSILIVFFVHETQWKMLRGLDRKCSFHELWNRHASAQSPGVLKKCTILQQRSSHQACVLYSEVGPHHNHEPMSFSSTAAASILPITLRMFIRSVTAVSSRCRASHKSRIWSVGLAFVAK